MRPGANGGSLPESLVALLRRQAAAAYPREACGLLAGLGGQARAALPARNLSVAGDRFLLDPLAWLQGESQARQRGLVLLGVWHSHPDAPPIPSLDDAVGAVGLPADWVYAIASVVRGEPRAVRVYSVADVREATGPRGVIHPDGASSHAVGRPLAALRFLDRSPDLPASARLAIDPASAAIHAPHF